MISLWIDLLDQFWCYAKMARIKPLQVCNEYYFQWWIKKSGYFQSVWSIILDVLIYQNNWNVTDILVCCTWCSIRGSRSIWLSAPSMPTLIFEYPNVGRLGLAYRRINTCRSLGTWKVYKSDAGMICSCGIFIYLHWYTDLGIWKYPIRWSTFRGRFWWRRRTWCGWRW